MFGDGRLLGSALLRPAKKTAGDSASKGAGRAQPRPSWDFTPFSWENVLNHEMGEQMCVLAFCSLSRTHQIIRHVLSVN